MNSKLIVDLAKCDSGQLGDVKCSYKHHPDNAGFEALMEAVRFAMVCRKCEGAPCVTACPQEALEKVPDSRNDAGTLKRNNMLCTGCGTCTLACPFGTIYTDLMQYASSVCDVCRGRLYGREKPLCVKTCNNGALDYRKAEPDEEPDMVELFENVLVRVPGGSTWQPLLREELKADK